MHQVLNSQAPLHASCNLSWDKRIKIQDSILLDIQAKELEITLKNSRKKVKDVTQELIQAYKYSAIRPSNNGLALFSQSYPAFVVTEETLARSKNILERMSERDISPSEIMELAQTALMVNPLQIMHERKRDIKVRKQVEVHSQVSDYINTLNGLHQKALNPNGWDESKIFQEQQKFLPSYSRRTVMFGYPLIAGK